MATRASVFQGIQLGVEVTPGTAVAANRRLPGMTIQPGPRLEIMQHRPAGSKYLGLTAAGKDHSEARVGGIATYDELLYGFSSAIDAATITTPVGATLARNWQFVSANNAPDAGVSYTIQQGASDRAHRVAGALFRDFGITMDRNAVNLTGQIIARKLNDGITLTADPTLIEARPVLPAQIDVFADPDDYEELGTTKLRKVLRASWQVTGRYGPVWALDTDEESWVDHVELEPTVELKILIAAEAVGMSFLEGARANDRYMMRLRAQAPADSIETDSRHALLIDQSAEVVNVAEFSDADGVFAIEYTFGAVQDAAWAKAFEINIVTARTAL